RWRSWSAVRWPTTSSSRSRSPRVSTSPPRGGRREADMRNTTPAVHLIAEPRLRLDAVEEYLDSVGGLAWLDRIAPRTNLGRYFDGVTDAEALVEFAGRGCYRSWEPGLNANVTKVRE